MVSPLTSVLILKLYPSRVDFVFFHILGIAVYVVVIAAGIFLLRRGLSIVAAKEIKGTDGNFLFLSTATITLTGNRAIIIGIRDIVFGVGVFLVFIVAPLLTLISEQLGQICAASTCCGSFAMAMFATFFAYVD